MEQKLKSEYGRIDFELGRQNISVSETEVSTRRVVGKITLIRFGDECFCEIKTEIRDWIGGEYNFSIPFRLIRKIVYITEQEYLDSLQEHREAYPKNYQQVQK